MASLLSKKNIWKIYFTSKDSGDHLPFPVVYHKSSTIAVHTAAIAFKLRKLDQVNSFQQK